jgi:HEAT repeat protein
MRRTALILVCAILAAPAWCEDVSVVGGGGKNLEQLAGTPTIVTVVLKDRGVEVPNLKVSEVLSTHFNTVSEENRVVPFMKAAVAEVRIQGDFVEEKDYELPANRALRAEEQEVLQRAVERGQKIFNQANDNQVLKMQAAVLLTIYGNSQAEDYLERLADSNDLETRLDACIALYTAGAEVPADVLREGFESGNRTIRGKSAVLAGLLRNDNFTSALNTMMSERPAELAAPAARTLAKLGVREIIPKLLEMMGTLNKLRNEAAVFALAELGGSDIIEQMKLRLPNTEREAYFRHVLVLYRLGDPLGKKRLLEIFRDVPTLTRRAALELASEQIFEVQQFLRDRLQERVDPTECNMIRRAENAAALVRGNDHNAMAVLQELLRSDKSIVVSKVYELVAELNERRLLTLIEPGVENVDLEIAANAATAVIALTRQDFRERLLEVRDECRKEDPCLD